MTDADESLMCEIFDKVDNILLRLNFPNPNHAAFQCYVINIERTHVIEKAQYYEYVLHKVAKLRDYVLNPNQNSTDDVTVDLEDLDLYSYNPQWVVAAIDYRVNELLTTEYTPTVLPVPIEPPLETIQLSVPKPLV